jgi:hypothetical protein
MRRLVPVFCLAMLAVCLAPVPAHAYFWEWLDSLSGPKFAGATVEVKVWCRTDRRSEVIGHVRTSLAARSEPFIGLAEPGADADPAARARFVFATRGLWAAKMAESLLDQAGAAAEARPGARRYDPSEVFFEALRWRDYAYSQFVWAERAATVPKRDAAFSDDIQRAALLQGLPTPKALEEMTPRLTAAAFGGLTFSVCPAEALDRHKQTLDVSLGYGWDQKEANQAENNRMLTVGASYNFIVAPWLTLGFGGGQARFMSANRESFSKTFVQPWIIDVRPFALRQKPYSPDAWRQVWFVRVSSVTFLGGFDEERFAGSPRLRNELVHSIGVHADLDPIIRKARLRW